MNQLSEIVVGLLHSRGLWNGYQIGNLISNWGKMVGDPLGKVTRAKDFSRGRLRVIVQDPVWGFHLSMMKTEIINKLNVQLGNALIKDVYFQVGEITTPQSPGQQTAVDVGNNIPSTETGSPVEFKNNLKRLRKLTVSDQ